MGFDQWAAQYHHYRVISSKIVVKFVFDTTDAMQGSVGIALLATTTIPSHAVLVENRKNYKWKNVHDSANNIKDITVSQTYSARKFFGPRSLTQDQYASVGGNPTEDVYFAAIAYRRWLAPASATVVFDTRIEYYVEFCEPKMNTQS